MMAKEKKKVPNLRFKGFTDDWEQHKLKTVVSVNSGKDYKSLEKGNIPVYGTGGYITSVSKSLSNQDAIGLGRKGTINKPYILKAPFWTVDTLFYLTLKPENILTFIYSLIQKINWLKYDESTGLPSLSKKNIENVLVYLTKLDEQQKIGKLIVKLDKLITLQQRKLDLLKQLKKGLLQKMFADKDSERPVLRFKGFHDDWEQRRLGEVTSHRGGTAIEKYFDENGEYKVISIGSYGLDSKYVDQNIRAKSNEVTNERVVHAGELTMVLNDKTANGTIIGRSLLIENDNEYVINQRTEIIKPEESFNAKFAYTLLNGPFRNKVKRIVQGGTQIYVNYSSVEKLTVPLPNMKEQQKIGSFFNQLDSLIALHQRKQNHLKLLKKSLLQQMFM